MSFYGNKFIIHDILDHSLLEKAYNNFNLPDEVLTEAKISERQEKFTHNITSRKDNTQYPIMPVYIVLLYSDSTFDHIVEKFVKDQDYWHASIAFDPELKYCYSFNFGEAEANKFKGGLSFESYDMYKEAHPNAEMQINCVLLDKESYNFVLDAVDFYIKNKKKTKYSFVNLAYSFVGHKTKNGLKYNLVCSTFVDTILKSADVDISNKKYSNLVKPDDLKKKNDNKKQFKLFEGNILKYSWQKVKEKVEQLCTNIKNSWFSK